MLHSLSALFSHFGKTLLRVWDLEAGALYNQLLCIQFSFLLDAITTLQMRASLSLFGSYLQANSHT
jgi:hypothetical protein